MLSFLKHHAQTLISKLPLRPSAFSLQPFLLALFVATPAINAQQHLSEVLLRYSSPAAKWTDALPVGNGHMGAMVFGGTASERIQFNEATLWNGAPHDYAKPEAYKQLPEIRRLITENRGKEADKLAKQTFLGTPPRQRAYQPFGDLRLAFPGHEKAQAYSRTLDLASATATTSYTVDGVTFTREVFASYPDRALFVRLTASKPGALHFTISLDSPHKLSSTKALANDLLELSGSVQTKDLPDDAGTRFASRLALRLTKGSSAIQGNALVVANADEVVLILVARTSFITFQDISGNPSALCEEQLKALANKPYAALRSAQLADHRTLFERSRLSLPASPAATADTSVRIQNLRTKGPYSDPSLAALHYHYGRYLLISSSRAGSQPANLQGVWNELLDPPWESKWTTNINVEMNYWPVETTGLPECHTPLFDMIDDLVLSGRRTAKAHWNSRGWVVHHNTDIWRGTAPINNVDGIWPTGGAWLCFHLWEHFQFTQDKAFLRTRALPVMREACLFFLDSMVKDARTGYLVTCPSYSPEQDSPAGSLVAGPAMDNQIIGALFDATVSAAKLLGEDDNFIARVASARAQLPPHLIGKHGQLQEWLHDYDRPGNTHRHMSPLFALYPGYDINPTKPEAFAGALKLLTWRCTTSLGNTGWSYAWRIPLWARAGNAELAAEHLYGLLQKKTLPNLFDLCGPFQIDGNFGACAGVAEMLIQSHLVAPDGSRIIDLLPTLPSLWTEGSVTGLRARDGFELTLTWKGGKLTTATIKSLDGKPALLRYQGKPLPLHLPQGATQTLQF